MDIQEVGQENEKIATYLDELAVPDDAGHETAYLHAVSANLQVEALLIQAEILQSIEESLRYIVANTSAIGA